MPMGYRSEGASKEKINGAGGLMLVFLAGAGVGAIVGQGLAF